MTTRIILVVICTVLAVVSAICTVRAYIDTYRIKKIYRFELQRCIDDFNCKMSAFQKSHLKQGFPVPAYWIFVTDREIALRLSDGETLEYKVAISQYPKYFNGEGKPLLDKLPFKRGEVWDKGDSK